MSTEWTVTFDCAHPVAQAGFWQLALGYAPAGPPKDFASWPDWFAECGVPEEEWDDGAALEDPDGVRPRISFLKVPESKAAKNRVHLDVQAGGGRSVPIDVRWPRVTAKVEQLVAAGAEVVKEHTLDNGVPDHVQMRDPEGNEFCVL